jgi:hypothetical protein
MLSMWLCSESKPTWNFKVLSSVLHGVMADTFTFALHMQDPTILHTTNGEEENYTICVECSLDDSVSPFVVRVV